MRDLHVVPHEGRWAVTRENTAHHLSTFLYRTQKEAIDSAKVIAASYGCKVMVHREDGTIREHTG